MKKWGIIAALLMLIAAIIIGCGPDGEQIQSDFSTMLEGKATPESVASAAEYLDQNIGKAGKEIGSQMMVAYEDYLIQYLNSDADWNAMEAFFPYWNFDESSLEADKIQSEETKALYDNLMAGGFKFDSSEGMVYPIIDYKALIERYGSKVTESLNSLYVVKQMESDKPMARDAALVIGWDELAQRAYATEQYIQTFKEDTLTIADAQFIYENYINTMLLGMNNTPIFDYETTVFSSEAKTAYGSFINEYPNSVTSWMLKEYMVYLESAGYKMDYNDATQSKAFFDTCSWLVSEAGKKVLE